MAYSISIVDGMARITLKETLTNQDLEAIGREAAEVESRFEVMPPRITDLRQVTRLEITFDGVLRLANERLRLTFPNSFKSAIVANDVAHYGFARMFQTLNDHPQISIAIFSDPDEAMEWLVAPGLEVPSHSWAQRPNPS